MSEEVKLTDKQIKKIEKVIAVLQKAMQYRIILRNHNVIASSSIPKHKQKKHNQLVAEWVMKTRNMETELDKLFNKLKPAEQQEFLDRSKALRT